MDVSVFEPFMRQALELSKLGAGHVSPNPLVGCVLLNEHNEVIGEGFHAKFGDAHAEVAAVRDAESRNNSVIGGTAVVTLEPCNHFGKTPPCTDFLIEKKIRRCIVAMRDPNPNVTSHGADKLREHGIEVHVGLLEQEAQDINRFFIKHVTTGLPYITLKLAMSIDGRSALAGGHSKWITGEESRRAVHELRAAHDAVMIGSGTARTDNPALTVRDWDGSQPRRIVLDTRLDLPESLQLFNDEYKSRTIVVTSNPNRAGKESLEKSGVRVLQVDSKNGRIDLRLLFELLGKEQIASILIEAGPALGASIIREGLFDEVVCFIAPKFLGAESQAAIGPLGVTSLSLPNDLEVYSSKIMGQDIMIRFKRR